MDCAMPPIPIVTESSRIDPLGIDRSSPDPLLRVRDLRVSFRLQEGTVRAVDGVSFDVFPSQVVGIVGESGCGKRVPMRAILQLIDPPGRITSGQMLYPRADAAVDLARLAPHGRL